jgi:hypothetical protein
VTLAQDAGAFTGVSVGHVWARASASENASRRGACHENDQLVLCVCACVHAQGSIRATVKERFLNVVREIQPANGWKVVVVDAASTKLISRWVACC